MDVITSLLILKLNSEIKEPWWLLPVDLIAHITTLKFMLTFHKNRNRYSLFMWMKLLIHSQTSSTAELKFVNS